MQKLRSDYVIRGNLIPFSNEKDATYFSTLTRASRLYSYYNYCNLIRKINK